MTLPGLAVFTVVVLHHDGELLLLRRDASKRRFPGRWTGIGGQVEPDELDDVAAAALRELEEEANLVAADVEGFALRRTLTFSRPGEPTTCLFFFTGELRGQRLPACEEGELRWVSLAEIPGLDVIETARAVLPRLIEDVAANARGVRHGAARFGDDGRMTVVVWA